MGGGVSIPRSAIRDGNIEGVHMFVHVKWVHRKKSQITENVETTGNVFRRNIAQQLCFICIVISG